ncbi:MAG: RnfABCDGE type electron transport complex subunit D [Candidatus Omnitrophica bacterium]|jgi:electron transport complex protein RnfD|nr:RnfABCDGE type electron transport complex subunit D [Candidatus Omnitrophota bacterium]
MGANLQVNTAPHLYKKESVAQIMWFVILSLIPAGAAGVYIFGMPAFWVILTCVITAVVTEALVQVMMKKKVTICDGSAFMTGLLLAYNLPSSAPMWLVIAGSVFSIAIGKQIFGGLGQNIFNPALAGRAFLMASWPQHMTSFPNPFGIDAVTSPTPLTLLKEGKGIGAVSYLDLFLGNHGGCIGEVCILALLAGALFLLIRGYIGIEIPFTYIATVALFTFIFSPQGFFKGDWLFHILSGGLILGAFFMATDYVTSPLSRTGQIVFGIGCGILTAVIRLWGGYPEGASYAILMMNAAVPVIDRYTKPRVYGK